MVRTSLEYQGESRGASLVSVEQKRSPVGGGVLSL